MKNKFLVIGDGCVDIFKYGKCKRLCPEAPVPVFTPKKQTSNFGMALNVYHNMRGLKEDVDSISNELLPKKIRFIDIVSNQMLLREDVDDEISRIDNLDNIDFKKYVAIVISDYNKGFLIEQDIEYIIKKAKENDCTTFLDTKKKLGDWAKDVDVIKINNKEFGENSYWLDVSFRNYLVVTKGESGATFIHNRKSNYFSIEDKYKHPVRDLSGAGDTFLAALTVEYISNHGDIKKAINFANICASWVVSQKSVVQIRIEKIKELYNL